MSAWDIAGAVVWTVLAVFSTVVLVGPATRAGWFDRDPVLGGPRVEWSVPFTPLFWAASIFCIARLCGAHA